MPENYKITLSAFADEAANRKTAVEQMSALAALGLKYYSPRFVDVTGEGTVEHVVDLSDEKLALLSDIHAEYGMSVASIGSRIGKVKLLDVDDGTHNRYLPFDDYLETEVASTLRVARALDAKLIRGFSFYHPRGENPESYVEQAAEKIARIADRFASHNIVYGLEVEANLIGQNGRMLSLLAQAVDRPNLVCIFDGGNLSSQNLSWMDVYNEYLAMREHMGWAHIKDYAVDPSLKWTGVVDEERLKNFVPANVGDSAHEAVLRDLRKHLPAMNRRMQAYGCPGVFLELEPHLKGGGQFGGFSGPDGMGVAVRALCSVLDYVGIDYDLRTMDDIRQLRGF
jgi:sugar phosphate isomerase/epimerase